MERLKEELLEVEKQRDERDNTIGKLRQVKTRRLVSFQDGTCLCVCLFVRSKMCVLTLISSRNTCVCRARLKMAA